MGSKFFPFRVDPFSEGRQNNFKKVNLHENKSILLKYIERWEKSVNETSDPVPWPDIKPKTIGSQS